MEELEETHGVDIRIAAPNMVPTWYQTAKFVTLLNKKGDTFPKNLEGF